MNIEYFLMFVLFKGKVFINYFAKCLFRPNKSFLFKNYQILHKSKEKRIKKIPKKVIKNDQKSNYYQITTYRIKNFFSFSI